jgi:hypothetical protein
MTDNPNKLAFTNMTRDDQDKIAGAIARGESVEYLVCGKWECDPPSLVFWSLTYRLPPPLIADGSLVPEQTPIYMSIKPAKDPQRPRPAHKLRLRDGDVVELVGWQDRIGFMQSTICTAGESAWLQVHIDRPLPKGKRPLFVIVSRAGGEA